MLKTKLMILRRALLKKFFLACCYYCLTDKIIKAKNFLGYIGTSCGEKTNIDAQSIAKNFERIHDFYTKYARVQTLRGRVLEVGPGGSHGLAHLLVAQGCDEVVLVDRFRPYYNEEVEKEIIDLIVNKYVKCQNIINLKKKIVKHIGLSAENFFSNLKPQKYNFILSCDSMEHLSDPIFVLKCMVDSLAKGGKIVCHINLDDHGMFSGHYHELKFLEVPYPIYKLMTHNSGRPNRIRFHQYLNCLKDLGINYFLYVTRLIGGNILQSPTLFEKMDFDMWQASVEIVRKMKKKFAKEFQNVPDELISIQGFILVCEKNI